MLINQKISVINLSKLLMIFTILFLAGCTTRSEIGEPRTNIAAAEEVYEIGVNAYLWRASLDTLAFLPMVSADQSSGVIITDWKVNPNDANDRSKVDVFIVSKELRADALKVSVHRETLQNGTWVSTAPRNGADAQVINAIIIQARLLRRDNAPTTN